MDGLGSISLSALAALAGRLASERFASEAAVSAVKRANETQELALEILLATLSPSPPGAGGHVDVLA